MTKASTQYSTTTEQRSSNLTAKASLQMLQTCAHNYFANRIMHIEYYGDGATHGDARTLARLQHKIESLSVASIPSCHSKEEEADEDDATTNYDPQHDADDSAHSSDDEGDDLDSGDGGVVEQRSISRGNSQGESVSLEADERQMQLEVFGGSVLEDFRHVWGWEPTTDNNALCWTHGSMLARAHEVAGLIVKGKWIEAGDVLHDVGLRFRDEQEDYARACECFLRYFVVSDKARRTLNDRPTSKKHRNDDASISRSEKLRETLLDCPNALWLSAQQCAAMSLYGDTHKLLLAALSECNASRSKAKSLAGGAGDDRAGWQNLLRQLALLQRKVHLDLGICYDWLSESLGARHVLPIAWRNCAILALHNFDAVLNPSLHPECQNSVQSSKLLWDSDACKAVVNAASAFLHLGKVVAAERCARIALSAGLSLNSRELRTHNTHDSEAYGDEYGVQSGGGQSSVNVSKAVGVLGRCLESQHKMRAAVLCFRTELEVLHAHVR